MKLLIDGIVPILDEQTQVAHGSDKRLISDVYLKHKQSPFLLMPHARVRHETFFIRHYAEDVLYHATGSFTSKNDGTIPKDLTTTMMASTSEMLLDIVLAGDRSLSGGGIEGGIETRRSSTTSPGKRKKTAGNKRTVAGDFAKSMQALTAELGRSQCSYIRCVKPNAQMKAGVYDAQYVVTQLRCLGLLQTCEVLKVGLPTRLTYEVLRGQLEGVLPQSIVQTYSRRPNKEITLAALRIFQVPRDA